MTFRVSRQQRLSGNSLLHVTSKNDNYISIMGPLTNEEGVLVTDEFERLISSDRAHLTKYGAILFGRDIILKSPLHISIKLTLDARS